MNPWSVPQAKVDPGSLAVAAAKLSPISSLRDKVVKQALFRGGMSASGMIPLRSSDGSINGGDGISGSGDDSRGSGDGDGDGDIGAAAYSTIHASMDGDRGV
ncbi:hypothetical protein Tco_0176589 [Tanacetum coccineum]